MKSHTWVRGAARIARQPSNALGLKKAESPGFKSQRTRHFLGANPYTPMPDFPIFTAEQSKEPLGKGFKAKNANI
jgi:hypothetical protein